ncbi:transcriptional regulator LldR [Pigmentiphaga sp.]|uniref:transcriptional regulator LldR n=1 Tax=Pigmentiphaga sp. TaxID=1977564 RepID=UPI00128DE53F|nr:transcriptional regulator LldR [Pigmentiphaga sp.]MPS28589.1 transcriptional regulator LldR [Alcaligenaceae bacterium SAGV5]MPS54241.1 transcriptional regulator LldR [Alcaligenaceae bacterium SAGV3]MPT55716.1 transcriptional regulator LldR [Alcaligenaceae bacterium]
MRLSDHVAEQLLALIRARGMARGERLPAERSLAASLGVSRASLRTAIQKLSGHGILSTRIGAGTFLHADVEAWPQPSLSPLAALMLHDPMYRYDVLETRRALEGSAAAHAALRASARDKDNIRRCFDQMVEHQQRKDATLSARADARFHLAIAEASHNLVLIQVMRSLFDLVLSTVARSRHAMLVHDHPRRQDRLNAQHGALMRSILDGRADEARAAMGEHLDHVHATLKKLDEDAARQDRSLRLTSPGHSL